MTGSRFVPGSAAHCAFRRFLALSAVMLLGALALSPARATTPPGVAVTVRHAPQLNGQGRIEGSIQQNLGESVTINGGAVVTQEFLVPGTPAVQVDGDGFIGSQVQDQGSAQPANYQVRVTGGASILRLRTQVDAASMPAVPTPPAPQGTRNVTLNKAGESVGNWAAVRNLQLNGQAGTVDVPPGTYGELTANSSSVLRMGVAGSFQPAVYNIQRLTLNGQSRLEVLGPVILHLANGFNANGQVGAAAHPEWLQVRIAKGGVQLNGGSLVHGALLAPSGTIIVNGQATLCGTALCDRFTLNGGGLVRWYNTSGDGGNRPPVANAQTLTTAEDQQVEITLSASDPDGNTLAYTVPARTQHGSLAGSAPNLIYTPDPEYSGPDSFSFTVSDGIASSAPATVSIQVQPVNDAPLALPGSVVVTEDTPLLITLQASDADGDPLSFSIPEQTMKGWLEKDTSPGAGAGDYFYWPRPDSNEPDSFVFRVADGQDGVSEARIQITINPINDKPQVAPLSLEVPEDGQLALTLTGTDADGDILIVRPMAGTGPFNGTLEGSAADFTYRPAANFHGADTFWYEAVDAQGNVSDPAQVSIRVVPVDDAPVALSTTVPVIEDTPVAFTVDASDTDGEPLTFRIIQPPVKGTLSGAGPDFIYTPHANVSGEDSFTFEAIDSADPQTLVSAPATVIFQVASVNDAPVAQPVAVVTREDVPVTITLSGSDVDGDALTYLIPRPAEEGQSFGPQHGTLTPTENPQVWIYTPALHSDVPDQFTFRVQDPVGLISDAVVAIHVTARENPVAIPLSLSLPEDGSQQLTLSGSGAEDTTVHFELGDGQGGGTAPVNGALSGEIPELIYTPNPNYFGADQFSYVAIDSFGQRSAPALVSINVLPVNDAPVAQAQALSTDEDTPIEIHFQASDLENDPVTLLEPTEPSFGTLEPLGPGHYRYHPGANFHGSDTFFYAANDGAADSLPAAVTIQVRPVNDAPEAHPQGLNTREDMPLSLVLSGSDIDGDALTILEPSTPQHGTLTQDPNAPGRFTYVPHPDFHGSDSFTFTVKDGEFISAPSLIAIEVESVNDAPIVNVGEDRPLVQAGSLALQAAITDDGTPEGAVMALLWERVSGPSPVLFSAAQHSQTFAYFAEPGIYVIRFTANDAGLVASDELTVTVQARNLAPTVAAGPDQIISLPNPISLSGVANDDGLPAGKTLTTTWQKVSGPGAVTFANQNALATTATFTEVGSYVLRLRASDSQLNASDELVVAVQPQNAAPVVNAGAGQSIRSGEAATLAGTATDDGLPLVSTLSVHWSQVSGPGTATFADATIPSTTATFSAPGTYVLRLEASDSELSASDDVAITVAPPENRAPVVSAGSDQTLNRFLATQLQGVVQDDGLPSGSDLSILWTKIDGPGEAVFANNLDPRTAVTFSRPGRYVLRLTANDGALSSSDEVIVVLGGENQSPLVHAGDDQLLKGDFATTLVGRVTDDGLPGGEPVSVEWRKVSGPGEVDFGNRTNAQTSATFDSVGTYVLALTGSDGELSAEDQVQVTVDNDCDQPDGLIAWWRAEGNALDAIGSNDGNLIGTPPYVSGRVERAFSFNGTTQRMVVPASPSLNIAAEGAFSVELWFFAQENPASGKPLVACTNGTQHGFNIFRDSSSLYFDIYDLAGGLHRMSIPSPAVNFWHHLAATYDQATGQGVLYLNGMEAKTQSLTSFTPRTSYDVVFANIPGQPHFYRGYLDEVSLYSRALTTQEIREIFRTGSAGKCVPGVNRAPHVNAGPDQIVHEDYIVSLQGAVDDDGLPADASVTATWTQVSGPSQAMFTDASDPESTVSFPGPGTYVFRLTGTDSLLSRSDDVSFTVRADGVAVGPTLTVVPYQAEGWSYKIYPSSSAVPANVGALDFDASDYLVGPAAFGSRGGCSIQSTVRTIWPINTDIVLRRWVYVPAGTRNIRFSGTVDNDVRVFLDGFLVRDWLRHNNCPVLDDTRINVTTAVSERWHLVVIQGHDFGAESYLDVRLLLDVPVTANAGADATINAGATVSLDGSLSQAASARTLTYQWIQIAGPMVSLDSSNPARPQFVAPDVSSPTALTFRLFVTDGLIVSDPDSVTITILPNTTRPTNGKPSVNAGSDMGVQLHVLGQLSGNVADDGLPAEGALQTRWTAVNGPGAVTFTAPSSLATGVSFTRAGQYTLRLTASDGQYMASDDVLVTVSPSATNQPPVVDAGPDQTVTAPASVTLGATVSDDGIPGVGLTVQWSKISGPGPVQFTGTGASAIAASFTVPGVYILRASASDTQHVVNDNVRISVVSSTTNQAPTIDIGKDRTITLGETVPITPSFKDDGLPTGALALDAQVVSGPGDVQFAGDLEQFVVSFSKVGVYTLRFSITDGELSGSDEIKITVTGGERPVPVVQLTAPANGASVPAGQQVTIQAVASQPEGSIERVDFYVDGVKIAESGAPFQTSWVPAAGRYTLTAVAIDNIGLTATSESVQLTAASLPTISWMAPANNALFQSATALNLQVAASDAGHGIAKVEFFEGATKLGEVASAPYIFSAGTRSAGVYAFTAVAHSHSGATVSTDVRQVRVAAPSNPSYQNRLAIVSPGESDSITAPTMIKGIIDLYNGYRWSLQYKELGSKCNEWITFGEGGITGVMENVELATLDTTPLANGMYAIRLLAKDLIGRTYSTPDVNLVVHGDLKIGEFTTSVNDLSIQLPGLSIDVTRTYSSAKRCAGDFGPGWSLDMNAVRLFKNYKLGENWIYDVYSPDNFMEPPGYTLADDGPHIVAIAFPSGEVYRFRPILTMTRPNSVGFKDPYGNVIGQTFLPIYYGDRLGITYQPLQGSEGCKLVPRGYRAIDPWTYGQQIVPANHEFYISDPSQGQLFLCTHENSAQDAPQLVDAIGFDLVMPDGRVFSFGEDGKLTRLTDRNSNWVEVRQNGVFHSSGKSVQWTRNADGQITGFQDFRGGKVEYFYSAAGELTGVKNRAGGLTGYEYEPDSRKLKRILDPSGIPQLGNEYDPSGRLVLQKSAFDNALTRMVHDFATQKEKIVDPLGNITTLSYDQKGQITSVEDALGNRTQYGYDDSGRRIRVVDPLGNAQRFAYENNTKRVVLSRDELGNVVREEVYSDPTITQITDPEGSVFEYFYVDGRPTRMTDALGRPVELAYDAKGNVTQAVDPLGNASSFSYNAKGQITSKTDALGQISRYEYDANGRMATIVDASGHQTAMTYDGNGNELTRTSQRTKSDGVVETLTWTSEYDASDRLVRSVDPLGRETRTVYDVNGRVAEQIDEAGRVTSYAYDEAGRPIRTTYPDGSTSEREYDLAGRVIKEIDAANRTTTFTYDKVGRLTKTTYSDGSSVETVYDAAGRVVESKDALGHLTRYSYDKAGRRHSIEDALGQKTFFEYDENGNLIEVTDNLDRVTTYEYDALNRRVRTLFADGTFTATAYDELGRVAGETDQNGVSRTYEYDTLGRLLSVTNALGQVTSFTYDELGNQLTQTDALGRTTSFEYDELGRRTKRKLPLGQIEVLTYDISGNVELRRDFNGRITTFAYDEMNRLLSRTPDPALGEPAVSFTYTATGRRATMQDTSGLTSYSYDDRDRLLVKTTPQGAIGYTYDQAGNIVSIASGNPQGSGMVYTYDALNRLKTVADANGKTVSYGYDEVGNLQSVALPNGVVSGYQYDALNRLVSLTHAPAEAPATLLAGYSYTLGAAGHRLGVTEASGRKVTYAYDALYRLLQETVAADPQGRNGQVSYTYDAVGNRLSRTGSLPDLPGQSFGYDANDRLQGDIYDANGNTRVGAVSQPSTGSQISPVTSIGSGAQPVRGTDTYNSEDRLIRRIGNDGAQVDVLYNGDGHKVQETVTRNGISAVTSYLVDELNPTGHAQVIEEYTNGTLARVYTYGHQLLSQDQLLDSGDWHVSYYGYDGHGSVRFLTNETGAVTDRYDYDAFGTLLSIQGATPNLYLYAGEAFNSELGLYYLRARLMNPLTGRFWNADTYEGQSSDPQSLHKYNYTYNDPVNQRDPSGNTPTLAGLMCEMALKFNGIAGDLRDARGERTALTAIANRELLGAVTMSTLVDVSSVMVAIDAFSSGGLGAVVEAFILASVGAGKDPYHLVAGALLSVGFSRTMAQDVAFEAYIEDLVTEILEGLPEDFVGGETEIEFEHNCFAPGTQVMTQGGMKKIEHIQPGEIVWAFDEPSKSTVLREVVGTFSRSRDELLAIKTADASIEVTREHPLWVCGKGWISADQIHAGDHLRTFEGAELKVEEVTVRTGVFTVHNFEVRDAHTYFVSAQGVLVHNASARALARNLMKRGPRPANSAAHHIVAGRDARAAAARSILRRAGVKIDSATNGVFLPKNLKVPNPTGSSVHSILHTNKYYRTITTQLRRAEKAGGAKAVRVELRSIAGKLQMGIYPH